MVNCDDIDLNDCEQHPECEVGNKREFEEPEWHKKITDNEGTERTTSAESDSKDDKKNDKLKTTTSSTSTTSNKLQQPRVKLQQPQVKLQQLPHYQQQQLKIIQN